MTLALESGHVASLFLVLLRVTGFIATAPILGHRTVPGPVKAGLVAVLAVTLASGTIVSPAALPFPIAAPIELLIGLCLGFILSLGFTAVELGGRMLSIQMGLSLGAVFDPIQGEAASPFDPFFSVFAGLLFVALDLHLAAIGILADSFAALPLGGAWPTGLFGAAAQIAALALELGTRVAMPLALILLLAELAVALVSRAIPQINVFFLGLPLKILLGTALVAVALPNLATGITGIYRFLFDGAAGALASGGAR